MRACITIARLSLLVGCSPGVGPNGPPNTADAGGAMDAGFSDAPAGMVDAADAAEGEAGSTPDSSRATYQNPVLPHDFPDPFVLRTGTTYYAYATNAFGKNVQVAQSRDLVTWTDLADALPKLPSWAASNADLTWAPAVLERPGSYVLYYTARDVASGVQCVSRAIAATPEGPYVDTSSSPFVCQTNICGSIDPSPFVDDDGTVSLVWKSDENNPSCGKPPRIWSQAMSADGVSVLGSPTELLVRDQLWEGNVIEGPSMVKSGGKYFVFYSANAYDSADYAVGYGVCETPHGPCQKMTLDTDGGSPAILRSAGPALGPGGEAFFDDVEGKTWVAYHAWTAPLTSYSGGGVRSLRIDPIAYASGSPVINGPTTTPQAL